MSESVQSGLPGYSPALFNFFQSYFQALDTTSGLWRPALKSAGRAQLEVASSLARQQRAFLVWQQQLMFNPSPRWVQQATGTFVSDMMDEYLQFGGRMTAAMLNQTEQVGSTEVVKLPVRRPHDHLVIEDARPQRQVA